MFLYQKKMVQHAILSLMAKTTDHYVMLTLDSCVITPISFDMWMFKFGHDTFCSCIYFHQFTMGTLPCESKIVWNIDIAKNTMITEMKDLLLVYYLLVWQIDYICEGWMAIYPPAHQLLISWSHFFFNLYIYIYNQPNKILTHLQYDSNNWPFNPSILV